MNCLSGDNERYCSDHSMDLSNNNRRTPLKMERPDNKCAATDPTMSKDPRVIANLLITERITLPSCDYFVHMQTDIQPFMRKVVATWMLEV